MTLRVPVLTRMRTIFLALALCAATSPSANGGDSRDQQNRGQALPSEILEALGRSPNALGVERAIAAARRTTTRPLLAIVALAEANPAIGNALMAWLREDPDGSEDAYPWALCRAVTRPGPTDARRVIERAGADLPRRVFSGLTGLPDLGSARRCARTIPEVGLDRSIEIAVAARVMAVAAGGGSEGRTIAQELLASVKLAPADTPRFLDEILKLDSELARKEAVSVMLESATSIPMQYAMDLINAESERRSYIGLLIAPALQFPTRDDRAVFERSIVAACRRVAGVHTILLGVRLLGALPAATSEARDFVLEMASHPSVVVQEEAVRALAGIAVSREAVMQTLARCFASAEGPMLKVACIDVAGAVSRSAATDPFSIADAMRDDDPYVRQAAVEVLLDRDPGDFAVARAALLEWTVADAGSRGGWYSILRGALQRASGTSRGDADAVRARRIIQWGESQDVRVRLAALRLLGAEQSRVSRQELCRVFPLEMGSTDEEVVALIDRICRGQATSHGEQVPSGR